MKAFPAPNAFTSVYEAGRSQVVWTEIVADLYTPVSAALKLGPESPYTALLESVEGGAVRGRYSFIALKPDVVWKCSGDTARISQTNNGIHEEFVQDSIPTLDSLRKLIVDSRVDLPETLPPMAAGIIGYMGYDTVRLVEDIPDTNPDTIGIPDGMFMRPTVMVIFDNVRDTITIVTPVRPIDRIGAKQAYSAAKRLLTIILKALDKPLDDRPIDPRLSSVAASPLSNVTAADYENMVKKAKEYIFAGDILQVVPSQRFRLPFREPAFALYRSLRSLNPSPFLFFLNFDGFTIVGSSPEILVRLRNGKVTIRPIAGTRPRGKNQIEDAALADELINDPKELAEHLMLLDLGRNDVGRVSKIGTVTVTDKMAIEYYSHVMHIVSNVDGIIAPEYDAMDALMAGFPAGTVSGAPKVRAMEIIDELEKEKRSFYAGAIGYIAANGDMDTCIALRTALVKDGEVVIQAGGGVVADSDPESEYRESCNKAQALIHAAKQAAQYR